MERTAGSPEEILKVKVESRKLKAARSSARPHRYAKRCGQASGRSSCSR